ncbi:MAG: hypothetical protein ACTSRG_11215 [Candidatus Helarchaeota archaeon]
MKVKLLVNNKKIPLKSFVGKVLQNIIMGFVETLKLPEKEIKSIEISIQKD